MEVLPKHFEASPEGNSYFTLILKNLTAKPQQVSITGLESETLIGRTNPKHALSAELDRRELEAPPNEICSVKVKVSARKDQGIGLNLRNGDYEEIRMEGSLLVRFENEVIRVRIGVADSNKKYSVRGSQTQKKLIYRDDSSQQRVDRNSEFHHQQKFDGHPEARQLIPNLFKSAKSVTAGPDQQNARETQLDSAKTQSPSTVPVNLEDLMTSRIKETESDFEESESSFLEFKRKLETGKLENLKMVSSFEPSIEKEEIQTPSTFQKKNQRGKEFEKAVNPKSPIGSLNNPNPELDQEALFECYEKDRKSVV